MQTTTLSPVAQILDGITDYGFAIVPHFLPPATITALADEAKGLHLDGAMRRAVTGQNSAAPDDKVRGDFIHWLEESSSSPAQQQYLQAMGSLRVNLNQSLYLGLFELESHFAIYAPGALYRKHLDQFQQNQQRRISCTLYLNQHWQHIDGGQLRLYLDGENAQPYVDIEPVGGTLVVFLSGRFYHEVLLATQERISLTGWFKTRADQPV